jgi:hypothetical protein
MVDQRPPTQDRPLDPEKLLRIASLAREVLEEVRRMQPAQGTVQQLTGLHERVTNQLYEALPKELVDELEAIDLDFSFKEGATEQEVRLAYSGLIGWLGGVFQGLQAAMQVQTLAQLQKTQQRELESPRDREAGEEERPGRYL